MGSSRRSRGRGGSRGRSRTTRDNRAAAARLAASFAASVAGLQGGEQVVKEVQDRTAVAALATTALTTSRSASLGGFAAGGLADGHFADRSADLRGCTALRGFASLGGFAAGRSANRTAGQSALDVLDRLSGCLEQVQHRTALAALATFTASRSARGGLRSASLAFATGGAGFATVASKQVFQTGEQIATLAARFAAGRLRSTAFYRCRGCTGCTATSIQTSHVVHEVQCHPLATEGDAQHERSENDLAFH